MTHEDLLKDIEETYYYDSVDPVYIKADIDFLIYLLNSKSKLLEESSIYQNFIKEEILSNAEHVKKLIEVFPHNVVLAFTSKEIKNNKEIVELAIRANPCSFEFASEELRNDKTIALLAIDHQFTTNALKSLGEELKKDTNFYNKVSLIAVKNNRREFAFASEEVRYNEEIALSMIEKDGTALQYTSYSIQDNKNYVIKAINANPMALEFASERLKNDPELVFKAVTKPTKGSAKILRFASEELRNNKEFVLEILQNEIEEFSGASNRLKDDRDFILQVLNDNNIENNSLIISNVSKKLKNDPEIVLKAIKNDHYLMMFASEELKNNREFIKEAMNINGKSLGQLQALKTDTEIQKIAINNNPEAYQHSNDEIQEDKELLLSVLNKNGKMLQYALIEYRNDKDIVLIALKNNIDSKQFIGLSLKEEIGDYDPIEYIESEKLFNQIDKTVENKNTSILKNKKKL